MSFDLSKAQEQAEGIAHMQASYYAALVRGGVPAEYAAQMTIAFVHSILTAQSAQSKPTPKPGA